MTFTTIDDFWAHEDKQSKEWQDQQSTYTDEMETIVQREYDKHGDDLGGLTPEKVAEELFKPDRLLTMEEVIWSVRGHWEDDFLM